MVVGAKDYALDTVGNIYSYKYGKCRLMKTKINWKGYVMVNITYDTGKVRTRSVHRLVAEAYLEDFDTLLQVNHRDGIKTNNSLCNLEMATARENVLHAYSTGLRSGRRVDLSLLFWYLIHK